MFRRVVAVQCAVVLRGKRTICTSLKFFAGPSRVLSAFSPPSSRHVRASC